MTGCRGQVQGQHQQQTYLARHHRRAQEGRHRDQGEEPRHAQQQGREVPVDPEFLQKLRKIHACPVRGVSWGTPSVSRIRACRSEQVEAVEDVLAVPQYLAAQPFAHKEERQAHGQQLDAEGQGLFLQLGDGLDEAEHDAHHRSHDDGRQGQDHDQVQGLDGVIDGKFHA